MKNRALIFFTLGLLANTEAFAQQDNGKKNVEKLCGCFSVNFRYAETFSPDDTYKYHDREDMNATELVLPIENTANKVVMQHLLVINDTMIIKHWREEWLYESPFIYTYAGNKVWNKKELPAASIKNTWTQTVWEVNDEPRYQGISSWITNNGKTYWESTADAPLPRREYTVRNDYNIMKRNNTIALSEEGYVHEQDNDKILRAGGKDKLIAQEKGYNTYYRLEDSDCASAKEWWQKNQSFWNIVRTEWTHQIGDAKTIAVKEKADDKDLNTHFFALFADWSKKKVSQEELPVRIKEIITKFLAENKVTG